MGAAIAPGCSGQTIVERDIGSSGSKGAGGGGASSSSASGDPCASIKKGDCQSPAQFHCKPCGTSLPGKCVCDSMAPLGPKDCAKSADFHCFTYEPYTTCNCVPGSPASAADCPPHKVFVCAGSDEPPVGCECVAITTPK